MENRDRRSRHLHVRILPGPLILRRSLRGDWRTHLAEVLWQRRVAPGAWSPEPDFHSDSHSAAIVSCRGFVAYPAPFRKTAPAFIHFVIGIIQCHDVLQNSRARAGALPILARFSIVTLHDVPFYMNEARLMAPLTI